MISAQFIPRNKIQRWVSKKYVFSFLHGSGRIKGKMCEQQHQHNYDSIQKAPIKTCDSGFVRIATLNFNASVHKYKKGCYKLLRYKYNYRVLFMP